MKHVALEKAIERFNSYNLIKKVIIYGEALRNEYYELLAIIQPLVADDKDFMEVVACYK